MQKTRNNAFPKNPEEEEEEEENLNQPIPITFAQKLSGEYFF